MYGWLMGVSSEFLTGQGIIYALIFSTLGRLAWEGVGAANIFNRLMYFM
jgi:hypothetical protein